MQFFVRMIFMLFKVISIYTGILINGLRLYNIRYADDTIVFADTLGDLQALMDRITHQMYVLEVNVNYTKLMIIIKEKMKGSCLLINLAAIERVKLSRNHHY